GWSAVPGARPTQGLYCALMTLNSCTASWGRLWRGSPSSTITLYIPSTMLVVLLNVSDPPMFTVGKNDRVASRPVPGTSSASERYCRELIGSVSICCCVMTADTSDLVVSTTGDSPVT